MNNKKGNIYMLELRARQVGESKELGCIISRDTGVSIYDQIREEKRKE